MRAVQQVTMLLARYDTPFYAASQTSFDGLVKSPLWDQVIDKKRVIGLFLILA